MSNHATELQIDHIDFRHVMGHLPTGVVAVTGIEPATGKAAGMIVGTFQSLSLDPPLVAFSIARTSSSWPKLRDSGRFSARVLAEGQDAVCQSLLPQGQTRQLPRPRRRLRHPVRSGPGPMKAPTARTTPRHTGASMPVRTAC